MDCTARYDHLAAIQANQDRPINLLSRREPFNDMGFAVRMANDENRGIEA